MTSSLILIEMVAEHAREAYPFMPYDISVSYQFDQSISVLRVVGRYFRFTSDYNRVFVSKQWRPWSDAAFCCVWSGFVLFAYAPQKARYVLWVKMIAKLCRTVNIAAPQDWTWKIQSKINYPIKVTEKLVDVGLKYILKSCFARCHRSVTATILE